MTEKERLKAIPTRHPLLHFIRDIVKTISFAMTAVSFIREETLWKGVKDYRWLSKAFVISMILISISLLQYIRNWYGDTPVSELGILGTTTGFVSSLWEEGKEIVLNGSYNKVMLLLSEILIFHFVRRTLMVVTDQYIDTTFKTFIATQIRMIGLFFVCMILEKATSIVLNIPMRWIGIEVLSPALFFLVSAYYTGIIIVDNYNEVYHMRISQSLRYCWQYGGVTLTIGIIVSGLFLIPGLGAIAGPILGAVIAARTMHYLFIEDHDRAWLFEKYPKKKKSKS